MSASKAENCTQVKIEVKAQNGLRKREVEKFLDILLKKENELTRDLQAPLPFVGHHSELCDQADSNRSLHNEVSTRNFKFSALKEVKDAINRIKDGVFGECEGPDKHHTENEECTGRIEIRRLRASPVARLCQHCLAERNAKEKPGSRHSYARPGYKL